MGLSPYNPSDRYRNRFRHRLLSWSGFFVLIFVFAGGGFFLGQRYGGQQETGLRDELEGLRQERQSLNSKITDLQAGLQTAEVQFAEVIQEYRDVLPDGELEPFVFLIRDQLKKGVNSLKLQRAIETVQSPRKCSDPDVLRLVVLTPAYDGPESKGLLKGLDKGIEIAVTAQGGSAQGKEGKVESWYDPAQKVSVTFYLSENLQKKKAGIMPFDYSFVEQDKEYRFHVEGGAKSFIKITYDICAL